MSTAIATLAKNAGTNENEMFSIVANTIMHSKKGQQATQEEITVFAAIASEYNLNPLTKEIFAFNNRGAIQPIVSVDGWLKIINSHPQLDGIKFENHIDGGKLVAITCKIFRKDRRHETEVTEFMDECYQPRSQVWQKWPARMLRHKALIQAARVAFGFSGIYEEDEANRMTQVNLNESIESDETDELAGLLELTDIEELRKQFKALPAHKKAELKDAVIAHSENLKAEKEADEVNAEIIEGEEYVEI